MTDTVITRDAPSLIPHPSSLNAPRRGRLGSNVAANAVNLLVTATATLWFTPYLTHMLGLAAYGLVALAVSLVPYLSLSTVILNSAVGRHVTIHLERGDEQGANQALNTCLWGTLALAALLMPVAAIAIARSDSLFIVPSGYSQDLKLLLTCMFVVFAVHSSGLPFHVGMISTNRLEIWNAISLGHSLIRVGSVVLIFQFTAARAWHVGAGMVCAVVLSVSATIVAWRVLTPKMRLSLRLISRSAFRELTSTGAWVLLDTAGILLFLNTELILVNRMLGPEPAGQYAAVLQWPLLLRNAVFAISPVFMPPMFYIFAQRDMNGLGDYCRQSIRLLGLAAAIPVGLVCGFSRPLLGLWLGQEVASFAPLLTLMTAHLAVNLSAHSLMGMQLATNKVKTPAIATLALGLVNVGAAVWLAGPVGWGVYGIAAACAVTFSMRMLLFGPLYAARTLRTSSLPVYRELFIVGLVTAAVAAAGWLISSRFNLDNWSDIAAAICAILAVCLLATLLFLRSRQGRESIRFLLAGMHNGGGTS